MSDSGSNRTSDVGLFALTPGMSIGRYRIDAVLGQGGFGITYRAHDTQLHRDVAVKEYLPSALAVRQGGVTVLPRSTEVADDFGWGRDRFVAEGRTLASLHDAPAIVRVFDFLEANGTAYIVMELVSGETLEARLARQKTLTPSELDAILWPLLDGLHQVHEAGFLHRDIKPANVLLRTDGRPTLIDFGASRAAMAGRSTAMTAIFTPGFAAVEQMTSARQGPWTDIYGLAATLYTAITGTTPPPAFDRMLQDTYRPLGELRPAGFDPGLLAGIDAGMAVLAQDRPQSIADWRGQLRGGVTHAPTMVMRSPSTREILTRDKSRADGRPARRRRPIALYVGLAIAVFAVLGGGSYFRGGGKRQQQQPTQTVALQDMKIEDLEKVLEARRKADAEAADKRRAEEEARAKAAAEAESKRGSDAELEKAKQDRIKAEQELEQLKARLEEQKKATADAQRQAQIEDERRKAEAAAIEKRRLEDEAQKKAAADAETKAKADADLARAQQEREKADAEARAKAEAETRQSADADARVRSEAEARAKEKAEAEAKDRKAAEVAESGLRLQLPDRQRLQVALSSLGFDTRGSDGAFGPRTREMISNWQKARGHTATGFLNANQQQQLQREAAAALQKYDDDQKKVEEEKKKAEDEKKRLEEEARARAAAVPGGSAPSAADSDYGGTLTFQRGNQPQALTNPIRVRLAGNRLTGSIATRGCGNIPVALTTDAEGRVSGTVNFLDGSTNCGTAPFSASGRVAGDAIELALSGTAIRGIGTLRKGVVPAPISSVPQTPDAPQATAPARPLAYGGAMIFTWSNQPGTILATTTAEISGTTLRGQIVTAICGSFPLSLSAGADGSVSGTVTLGLGSRQQGCPSLPFVASGKIAGDVLELTLQGPGARGAGTLKKGVVPLAPGNKEQASAAPTPAIPGASGGPPATATTYSGSLGISTAFGSSNTMGIRADLRVNQGRLSGEITERRCGSFALDLPLTQSGQFAGDMRFMEDAQCGSLPAKVIGRVDGDTLQIEIKGMRLTVTGTLTRTGR